LANATTDGVVLAPSAFSITFGYPPSMIATHEFVVPRSIPTTCLVVALVAISLLKVDTVLLLLALAKKRESI
jgi:hypothetical protein